MTDAPASTAALLLDDLPCMDNAAWRRGAPAFHREHGEAQAVLAALGLLTHGLVLVAGDAGGAGLAPGTVADLMA